MTLDKLLINFYRHALHIITIKVLHLPTYALYVSLANVFL